MIHVQPDLESGPACCLVDDGLNVLNIQNVIERWMFVVVGQEEQKV